MVGPEYSRDVGKPIEANVANCGVLLAVIDPIWGALQMSVGQRRQAASLADWQLSSEP
jgi:hypothetical protein